jgi:Domain of unknown function (DUF1707)
MLLGDQDREELLELLSRHAAAGRLELDELERRVALVLADLPPLPASGSRKGRADSRRGHGEVTSPRVDWTPTPERFRDPRSARIMRVWTDPDGGRHYVPDE